MVFKYWRPSFLESRNSVIHFHDVVYISDMLWTLDRKLIEEDFSDKLRPVLMATLRELNCRRVLFNDSTPSVGMSYYKRTGNQDGGSCDGSELQSDFGAHCHQVWFWGWLETAKQKRHILDGMEGPFLFCCVTWKQQLLCFCPGQLLCGVPCGLHHCEIISLVWNHSPVSHKPITFWKSDRFVAYSRSICAVRFSDCGLIIDCATSPTMTIFWDSKTSHCRRACVAPSGQQSEPNCQNGRGTLTLKKESVFSRQALSHNTRLFFGKHRILF